jgi:hypothetical protein
MSSGFYRETGIFLLRVLAGEGLSANTKVPPANTLKLPFQLIMGFATGESCCQLFTFEERD